MEMLSFFSFVRDKKQLPISFPMLSKERAQKGVFHEYQHFSEHKKGGIEKTCDDTLMSNHHLRNAALSLKAKGLLSLMFSLPEAPPGALPISARTA